MAKILIAEDDNYARKLLKAILEQASDDYEVIEAESGTEALALVEKNPPDLALLDVMMPGMDGFGVCQRLKMDEKYKSIPIIFVTALDNPSDKIQGFQAGGDDYVTKPVNEEEVIARVQAHLRIVRAEEERMQAMINAIKDMVTTYNHQMNQPLMVAYTQLNLLLAKVEGDESLERVSGKIKGELDNINGVLKKIQSLTEKVGHIKRTGYVGDVHMFDLD